MATTLVTKPATIRGQRVLVPARPRDAEKLEKLKPGVPLNTILRGPHRSRIQENFYHALVRLVSDGIGMHHDTLDCEIKYKCGKIMGLVTSPVFGTAVRLKSKADMDHNEFRAFVQDAIDLVCLEYLGGISRKEIVAQVDRMVAEDK